MATYTQAYDEREPLSEEGTMSFLDHLDELRKRLIRSALFIAAAFVVCWVFSGYIYNFLQVPVLAAMREAKAQISPVINGTTVVLSDTASYWVISDRTVIEKDTVIPPKLYEWATTLMGRDNQLVVPTVQGAFNLYIKVSFYAAIFFAVPFLLVQVWGFVAPGLYPHEKGYAAPIIIMASVFFLIGCAFAYYIAFPRAANFLLGVATGGNLRPLVTADEYFDLIIIIMLGLGVVFEIPTITFFTSRLGLVSPGLLLRVWRYAVVVIFIIAAVLSPTTDVPNLLVFAAPMLLLYFASVGIAWVFHRRRQTEKEYQASERKGS